MKQCEACIGPTIELCSALFATAVQEQPEQSRDIALGRLLIRLEIIRCMLPDIDIIERFNEQWQNNG